MKRKHSELIATDDQGRGERDELDTAPGSLTRPVVQESLDAPFDFTIPPSGPPSGCASQAVESSSGVAGPSAPGMQAANPFQTQIDPGPSTDDWATRDLDALFLQLDDTHVPAEPAQSVHSEPVASPAASDPILLRRAVDLLDAHTEAYFGFLHLPTFSSASTTRVLELAILCTGLLFSSDVKEQQSAVEYYDSGKRLALDETVVTGTSGEALALAQALILLSAYAVLGQCGDETLTGIKMHGKCMEVCRCWNQLMVACPQARSNGAVRSFPERVE